MPVGFSQMPQGSRKSRISCDPTGCSQRGQVGRMCRPSNQATTIYPPLPKLLVQMISGCKCKMRWCVIMLKPHVLMHMQWHIFQEPMQYAFKKSQVHSTMRFGGRRYGPITLPSSNSVQIFRQYCSWNPWGWGLYGFSSAPSWLLRELCSLVNLAPSMKWICHG